MEKNIAMKSNSGIKILSFLLILISAGLGSCAREGVESVNIYSLSASGGGPHGYYKTDEEGKVVSSGLHVFMRTEVKCSGAGWSPIPVNAIKDPTGTYDHTIINTLINQSIAEFKTGKMIGVLMNGKYISEWKGNSGGDLALTVDYRK